MIVLTVSEDGKMGGLHCHHREDIGGINDIFGLVLALVLIVDKLCAAPIGLIVAVAVGALAQDKPVAFP